MSRKCKDKNPYYFMFYQSAWLTGTSGLTAAERGVFITLLALIYENDGPIIRDDGRLARKCGLPTMPFTRALEGLISDGKIILQDDGTLHNKRAKEVIATRQNSGVAKASAGSLGGKKTQENQRASSSTSQAEVKLYKSKSNNKILSNKLDNNTQDDFESFYRSYPKRINRKAALARFTTAVKNGVSPSHIIAAAERYAEAHSVAGTDQRYIPAPDVWLNKGAYDDEFLPQPARGSPQSQSGMDYLSQRFLNNLRDEQDNDQYYGNTELITIN